MVVLGLRPAVLGVLLVPTLFGMWLRRRNANLGACTELMGGILGVVVIVRPATSSVEPGQLIALAAAFGFGVSVTLMKSLTRTESTIRIIFWMLVIQSVLGLAPCIWLWQWPTLYVWIARDSDSLRPLITRGLPITCFAFTGTTPPTC